MTTETIEQLPTTETRTLAQQVATLFAERDAAELKALAEARRNYAELFSRNANPHKCDARWMLQIMEALHLTLSDVHSDGQALANAAALEKRYEAAKLAAQPVEERVAATKQELETLQRTPGGRSGGDARHLENLHREFGEACDRMDECRRQLQLLTNQIHAEKSKAPRVYNPK